MEAGAQPSLPNIRGFTPLQVAQKRADPALLTALTHVYPQSNGLGLAQRGVYASPASFVRWRDSKRSRATAEEPPEGATESRNADRLSHVKPRETAPGRVSDAEAIQILAKAFGSAVPSKTSG